MCQGKAGCKDCGCAESADGTPDYDPKQIAIFINKYIFDNAADADTIQDAYVKTMVWLEEKKLPFTEGSISSNKEELKVVINDPNYLKDKESEKPGWALAAVIIGIILAIYWINKQP